MRYAVIRDVLYLPTYTASCSKTPACVVIMNIYCNTIVDAASILQDAETQLENEEGRLLRIQLELTQLKQELERKMNEKDDEIETMRCVCVCVLLLSIYCALHVSACACAGQRATMRKRELLKFS